MYSFNYKFGLHRFRNIIDDVLAVCPDTTGAQKLPEPVSGRLILGISGDLAGRRYM